MLSGIVPQFIVEGMVPNLLHGLPVLDDTMLDGVAYEADSSLLLGLISDKDLLG